MVDKRVIEAGEEIDPVEWYASDAVADRGKALADEYSIKFMETSAKSSINVEEAFITLAKDIKKRLIDSQEPTDKSDVVHVTPSGKDKASKKKCCGNQ
jgi:Ras-related protein Rab-8A